MEIFECYPFNSLGFLIVTQTTSIQEVVFLDYL
jgi:hypothetical protein